MIGEKTFHLLRSMGVATIGTLSQIPMEMMEKVLGKNGIDIWKKANGIDTTPVIPYWEQKSISAERTFDTDTTDLALLNNTLVGMVEKIAYELRKEEKLTSCITVKIRYSNFDTHTLQQRIPYTSFDHKLIELAKSLFVTALPAAYAHPSHRRQVQPPGTGNTPAEPVRGYTRNGAAVPGNRQDAATVWEKGGGKSGGNNLKMRQFENLKMRQS